jgi:hypothetical protein
MTSGLGATLLSVAVIAALALAIGALNLLRKRRDRKRAILMLVAAAVLVGNVMIWTVPL